MALLQSGAAPDQSQHQMPNTDMREGESNVTPEEQAAYDMFVSQAYQLIYGTGSGDAVEKAIQDAPDVVNVLSQTAAKTIISVEKSAKEAGKNLDDDVVFQAGNEIVQDLVDYAVHMGKVTKEQETEVLNQVIFNTIRLYGEQAITEGLITPEQQQAAAASMQQNMGEAQPQGAA